ncbi:MAG: S1C family serine protease [Luteolibacter sp.]
MKNGLTIFSASSISAGLTLCGLSVALAIEPPPDESKPPAALLGDTRELPNANTPPVIRDSTAFLGVATAEVPEMVADHLGLESGTGVIVRTVCPDSPAEKAGLSVNDIITAIDNEVITSPDHFSTKVGGSKIGDRISVNLIHKGNPGKVEVTLIERPANLESGIEQEPLLDGLPKAHADRLRGLLEQNLRSFGEGGFDGMGDARFENNFRKMREQLRRDMENDSEGTSGFSQNSTIRLMDQEGSVEIKTTDGSTHVTIRDKSNNAVWEGPWNTEADKAAAPENIRARIDRVGAGKGFNFRFGTFGD